MFKGCYTAIITPFKEDQSVDEQALRDLIKFQLAGGVHGLVVLGTTGESPTIKEDEYETILKIVVEEVAGKVPVIAGTGTNSTEKSVKNTEKAKVAGVDGALVVTPYYNKPTKKGQLAHFRAVADVGLPVIVYNIKGRAGINIETDTLMELAEHENIVAVKEASGDLNQMKDVLDRRPEGFTVLSGDDGLTYDLMKMGGDGVIGVAPNAIPERMSKFVQAMLDGDFDSTAQENEDLQEFFDMEFVETNPIPIKTALSLMGKCEESFRLPMATMEEDTKAKWTETLKKYELI